MRPEIRTVIIQKYGETLVKYFKGVGPESKLPFPKDKIRQVILEELLEETDPDKQHNLRMGYFYLEWFIRDEDYNFFQDFLKKYVDMKDGTVTAKSSNEEIIRWASIQSAAFEREEERKKDIYAIEEKTNLTTKK